MSTETIARAVSHPQSKRQLVLRDSLVFLALTCITLLLYALTLLLFRSFEGHRADLAVYWAEQGRDQLAHGRSGDAATSLRNALSYDPDNRPYELLLAQALAESGQTEQAMNYLLNLRDIQPGDGFINLELARLARAKGLTQQAIDYYHASIFGDWPGDGLTRRRNIRLELVDYLTSIHNLTGARAELLIASGNAANDVDINIVLGGKFAAIGDTSDALNSYQKALADDPHQQAALEAAGRLSLQLGDDAAARAFLDRDLQEGIKDASQRDQVMAAAAEAKRLEELSFSANLPDHERAEHLLLGKAIAEARFNSCSAQLGESAKPSAAMSDLKSRWKAAEKIRLHALEEDEQMQGDLAALIGDTEVTASRACGFPSGDDAILLRLATSRESNQ